MVAYLARRVVFLLISFVLAALLIFVLLRLLPGDPANALLSIDATPEQIAAAQAQVGSDKPIPVQLVTWLGEIARGDFGDSFISGAPVLPEIGSRLVVTITLTLIAFVISVLVAAVVGVSAAYRANTPYGVVVSGLSQLGIAVPVFWVGIIFVWIFA